FRDGATILSLAGWKYFDNYTSLIKPMLDNFYLKAIHHYSWIKEFLDVNWIFNAIMEALREDEAVTVLNNLYDELTRKDILFLDKSLKKELQKFIEYINENYYMPLPLIYAIDKYYEWQNSNPNAIPEAKEQSIIELYHLYRLDRYPEIARYQLYRHTYFAYKGFYVRNAFDKLLAQMNKEKHVPATQLIELSELQSTLEDPIDREIFSKMVFPGYTKSLQYDIAKFEEKRDLSLIVKTTFKDKFGDPYIFRQPVEPAEIGILYRLFYKEKLTKVISEQDQFLVLFDSNDRIIGGIIYQIKEDNSCTLDGIVLATQYRGRGLGRAMMEDFINRMYSQGID
ncbi:MAG TPA: GNAT family N-acetyltransferase, partial [Candidatus Kapabacteria bacterium]|nr:GNAT family N-acetyltransferase [Candidatus Kapabacteria bacterium]